MKKILLATLLFIGLTAAAPMAQAGQFARVYTEYGVAYVPKAVLYAPYYASGYAGCRPPQRRVCVDSGYYRPAPSCRAGGFHRPSCRDDARPRIAISFGF
jgi:hypothetical protein